MTILKGSDLLEMDQISKLTSYHSDPSRNLNAKYAAAKVDFSNVSDLNDLVGTGTNSTCCTCSDHYSISFVSGIDNATTTDNGFKYLFETDGNNLSIQIDVESLKQNGVDSSNLTEAIVKIVNHNDDGIDDYRKEGADEDFTDHYTRYASKGSTLYVFDGRADQTASGSYGRWYTEPYNIKSTTDISINLTNPADSSDKVSLNYKQIDFSLIKDNIIVNMTESGSAINPENESVSGDLYIKKKEDGSYVKYNEIRGNSDFNAEDFETDSNGNLKAFNITTVYKDQNGQSVSSLDDVLSSFAQNTVQNLVQNTKITLAATNYSTINISADENHSVAVRANFNSILTEKPYNNGIEIVHSGAVYGTNRDDITTIPRFAMNTVAMGISRVNTRTEESAKASLAKIQKGLDYVTDRRSTYGAYQNRLEHTIRNNENKAENTQAAESRIRDTDMAEEMVRFTKEGILKQAGQSMLAQANQNRQGLLSLLQ